MSRWRWALVAFAFKPWLGLLFLAAYAVYFWREIRRRSDDARAEGDELEPLKFRRATPHPSAGLVVLQTRRAGGDLLRVPAVREAAGRDRPLLGLSPAVTALLLSPIATELPEIMNAIIWVRQGKTKLALANISGAMMIQATVPSALGLLFTPWLFDGALLWSGLVTIAAIVYLLITMRFGRLSPARLAVAAAFYLVFAIGLVPILSYGAQKPPRATGEKAADSYETAALPCAEPAILHESAQEVRRARVRTGHQDLR